MTNPLVQLCEAGQAVWLDYLHRKMIDEGELKRLIDEDSLRGETSNPSIFEKAIGEGDYYDARVKAELPLSDSSPMELYERLAIPDIQAACEVFRPTWERLKGADGYVSLEVSPYLANDTEATIAEARRLWAAVGRPNLMIKVPGTKAGTPAIRRLIGEGINVNVTLLFGLQAYLDVAEAHMAGLEDRLAAGGEIAGVHGVASFFVSRIDTAIDKAIDQRVKDGDRETEALKALRGKVAIANARIAYQRWQEMDASPRWKALAEKGATTQRLLWASTGTKDPAYSDILYVTTLIGPQTINTMPPKTMDAFRDHGEVKPTLTTDLDEARHVLSETKRVGLDLDGVTDQLVEDGVRLFAEAFDKLLSAVAEKRDAVLGERQNRIGYSLPQTLSEAVEDRLDRAAAEGWPRRIWAGDASLWTAKDEASWLGWLDFRKTVNVEALEAFAGEVRQGGFGHAVLIGMGGSSLAPEVLSETFGPAEGHPPLIIVDSTDPDQIADVERAIDPGRTLFIVSSKSGTTLEPDILSRRFFQLAEEALGEGKAGAHFVAVTDPGSALEKSAHERSFRHVFPGEPAIGGRYSALSNFGLVPAAALGLPVRNLLDEAERMARACAASAPPRANPGVHLGIVLGEAARAGRNKLTIFASPGIADIGAWLEQLVAESTGKQGKGIVPVDREPPGEPRVYGDDRIFLSLRLRSEDDPAIDEPVRALEEAGQPVVRIVLSGKESIAQEFFRLEMAIATAGAVIGINPFDQPDVEAAKVKARQLTDAFESGKESNGEAPALREDGLALYAPADQARALGEAAGAKTLPALLAAHVRLAGEGGYVGLLAYLERKPETEAALTRIRTRLRDETRRATVLGFGPRFQHSTGQAYKGGPAGGVFLQITHKGRTDVPIPGRNVTFAVVEAAQAQGDLEVLAERGRKVLRADLGPDVEAGLSRLAEAFDAGLD